jgi:NAD+ kinase
MKDEVVMSEASSSFLLPPSSFRKVGIFLHPSAAAARELAAVLTPQLTSRGCQVWSCNAWDRAAAAANMPGTDLLICVGGDGTVLRGARAAIPHPVRILAVNMGRFGFLAELTPEETPDAVLSVLDGAGRVEERSMIAGELCQPDVDGPALHDASRPALGEAHMPVLGPQYALNDIVVGRYAPGRPVYISVVVDGELLETVRADGMIVATATGSTGYSLSAGGPVLFPEARQLVLTPVAAHLSRVRPMVLPEQLSVELRVETDHRAVVSFDGQIDEELTSGACVRISRSQYVARFIRLRPPADFYHKLISHLNEPVERPEYPFRQPS